MQPVTIGRLLSGLLVATMVTSCASSQQRGSTRPSSTASPTVELDEAAQSVCPMTVSSFRLSGGHLVAGYETTFTAMQAAVGSRVNDAADAIEADAASVLCWYDDVTLTPPFGRGEPKLTDAVAMYVDGQQVGASTVDRAPRRP
jgi:hypothetical protein